MNDFVGLLPVFTSFMFFSVAVITFMHRMYFHSLSWIIVAIVSSFYHICKFQESACIVVPFILMEQIDHIIATAHGAFVFLEYYHFLFFIPTKYELLIYFSILTIKIIIAFIFEQTSMIYLGSKAIIGIIPLVLFTMFFIQMKMRNNLKNEKLTVKGIFVIYRNKVKSVINVYSYIVAQIFGYSAITFLLIALLVPQWYEVSHSLWHILSTLGIVVLLLSTKTKPISS